MPLFRRSLGARTVSVGSVLLFSILEAGHLLSGGAPLAPGGLMLGALIALGLAASLLNLGDRIRIDESGIEYSNPLLARFGVSRSRRIAWPEVVSFRAHHLPRHREREDRPSALFLRLTDGRRFMLDSVERFDEVRRLVAERVPADDSGPAGAE